MGETAIVVKHDDGSAITVYPQGAHLTSWRNKDGEELLYTSPNAVYKKDVPIRGGVPIIFPQFGKLGPYPAHGFARLVEWSVQDVQTGMASFTLTVPSHELQRKDGACEHGPATAPSSSSSLSSDVISLLYTITFNNDQLQLQMEICSRDATAEVEFMFAFHTYFAVSDAMKTVINGLNLTSYMDNLAVDRNLLLPPKPIWTITREIDRIYPEQRCAVVLMDMAKRRSVHISGINLPSVVLWNPFEKAAQLQDLPPNAYKDFVCVEHGAIGKKVRLPPLGSWKGSQCITLLPCSKM